MSAIYNRYAPILTITGNFRTPMVVHTEIYYTSKVPYREAVDALLWCPLVCRPDLSCAVNQVAKFNSDPGILHWEAVKSILLYAYQNKDWGILH